MRKAIMAGFFVMFFFILTLNITLAQKNNQVEQILYAAYLSPGAFSTVIDYTLEPYLHVQNTMKELVTSEELCGKSTTVECLAEKTKNDEDFNYYFKQNGELYSSEAAYLGVSESHELWNKYCEKADEEFFSDFAEFYDICMQTGENCFCKIQYFNPEALKSGSSITFKKISDEKYIAFLSDYDKIFTFFTMGKDVNFPSEIKSENILNFKYINKNNKVTFSQNPELQKNCNAESQMIKVCAVSKNLNVKTKNPITGKLEETPLTFRFAFLPPNTPPPDVKGVAVEDLRRAKDTVVISWFKSPAKNVIGYNLYQQTSDFAGKTSEEIRKTISPLFIKTENEVNVKSINLLPKCLPIENRLCDFQLETKTGEAGEITSNIKPVPGTLIYESDTNRYYYILSIMDKTTANFGVTAVNKKNLESEKFLETPEAKSIDDIPPGYSEIINIPSTTPENSYVEFSKPKNIDGTEIAEPTVINYDLIQKCADATKNKVISSFTINKILQTSIPTPETDCILKVIAKKQIDAGPPAVFTPVFGSPEDADIINYLLQ